MNQSANTSLYFAQVDQDGSWSGISTYEYSSQTYSTNFPALADQGNTLYFASNKPGGYGGYDLYVSYRESNQNSWSEPQNLGSLINSPETKSLLFIKIMIFSFLPIGIMVLEALMYSGRPGMELHGVTSII